MCEMPSVYFCDRRKARKEHKCCECRGAIKVGESYANHHGVWDGSGGTYKVCEDCEALRIEVDADTANHDDRTPFGGLVETVFASRGDKWIARYMETKRKRGGVIHEWMVAREIDMRRNQSR